jgi:GxxExxY protein
MKHKGTEATEATEISLEEDLKKSLFPVESLPVGYNELSYRVIGAAIEVHRHLGPGFPESAYEEALAIELRHRGVGFRRQSELPIFYKEHRVGQMRLDFLVEDRLVLELKAVDSIAQVFRAQVLSYLRAGGFALGLLINFNVPRLRDGIIRIIET